MIYSCDEEGNLLDGEELSLNGTYSVTNIMIYPNGDCASTPSNNGICANDDSITQESDCPDGDWMSYLEEFENWYLTLEDSGIATINDGYETESLTYTIDTNQRLFTAWAPYVWPIKSIMTFGILLMLLQSIAIFFKDLAKTLNKDI